MCLLRGLKSKLCVFLFTCCRLGTTSLPASAQNINGPLSCSWLFGLPCLSGRVQTYTTFSKWGFLFTSQVYLIVLLNIVQNSTFCSYYGLTVWFPDMIKYIQRQEYDSRTKTFTKERMDHATLNFTMENQVHRQGHFFNDK